MRKCENGVCDLKRKKQTVPTMEHKRLKLTVGEYLPTVFEELQSDVRKRVTLRNPCILLECWVE